MVSSELVESIRWAVSGFVGGYDGAMVFWLSFTWWLVYIATLDALPMPRAVVADYRFCDDCGSYSPYIWEKGKS